MRTTLTLDDDVAATLERVRKGRDVSLRDLVNEALREGLKQMTGRPKRRATIRTRTVALGQCRVGNVDNIADVLAVGEGETFR